MCWLSMHEWVSETSYVLTQLLINAIMSDNRYIVVYYCKTLFSFFTSSGSQSWGFVLNAMLTNIQKDKRGNIQDMSSCQLIILLFVSGQIKRVSSMCIHLMNWWKLFELKNIKPLGMQTSWGAMEDVTEGETARQTRKAEKQRLMPMPEVQCYSRKSVCKNKTREVLERSHIVSKHDLELGQMYVLGSIHISGTSLAHGKYFDWAQLSFPQLGSASCLFFLQKLQTSCRVEHCYESKASTTEACDRRCKVCFFYYNTVVFKANAVAAVPWQDIHSL